MQKRVSSTVAATALGQVHYCACKDRVNVRFKERWFAMGRTELPGFRENLMRLLNDPPLIRSLLRKALDEAEARGVPATTLPTQEDLAEMLTLLDASLLVLEAQQIAQDALQRDGAA